MPYDHKATTESAHIEDDVRTSVFELIEQPPVYSDATVTVHHGDCLEVLRRLADNSVDAVVTDPPYGLEFMGKEWDGADGFRRSLNAADAGRESVFGRTSRTSPEYRTASKAKASPEQRGGHSATDGRPTYLGGLNPKCLVCDRWQRGSNPCRCEAPEWTQERLVRLHTFQEWCEAWARECLRVLKPGGTMLAFGGTRTWHRLACAVEDAGFEIRDSVAWLYGSGFPKSLNLTDDAGERTGWGTALKPAHEPVVMARKPLTGTVAANVATHGTGALNIDACRIGMNGETVHTTRNTALGVMNDDGWQPQPGSFESHSAGRWPTNVVLDESQAAELDAQSGVLTSGKMQPTHTTAAREVFGQNADGGYTTMETYGDAGGASRFFYVAKADQSERVRVNGVVHPTVKPLDIMRWLVRLVTPPSGTVLEPFAGSGTTVEACILEGFQCIAIEREETYLPLIVQRINRRRDPVAAVAATEADGGLFDLLADVTTPPAGGAS